MIDRSAPAGDVAPDPFRVNQRTQSERPRPVTWVAGIVVIDTDLAEAEERHGFREDLYSRWKGAPSVRMGQSGAAPAGPGGGGAWRYRRLAT